MYQLKLNVELDYKSQCTSGQVIGLVSRLKSSGELPVETTIPARQCGPNIFSGRVEDRPYDLLVGACGVSVQADDKEVLDAIVEKLALFTKSKERAA